SFHPKTPTLPQPHLGSPLQVTSLWVLASSPLRRVPRPCRAAGVRISLGVGETAMHGAAYKNLPGAVKFLADKGARIDIWNRKNKFGWTPLRIAEGYRFGNFKPS